MTNTLFIFENKNLFKNLSSLIFQLAPFYLNLLSLAWKNLGCYCMWLAILEIGAV